MSDVTPETLAAAIANYAKETPVGEVTTVNLDPACTTYAFGRYWVKVLKNEPKAREFTALHREFTVLDWIVRQNRATLDYKLHIPVPAPVKADGTGKFLEMPFLIMKSVEGEPLLKAYAGGASLSPEERAVFGEQIGRYLARTQNIAVKGAGLISVEHTGVHPGPWQKYYPALAEGQWKRLLGSGLLPESQLAELKTMHDEKRGLLIGETTGLSHNDFQLANFFADRATKKITGFVNFQNAGVATPVIDFVSFYLHCPDTALWHEVTKGFEAIRSLPDKFEDRLNYYMLPFALYVALICMGRKDETGKGYYLRRAFEAAAHFNPAFAGPGQAFAGFARPSMG